MKKQQKKSEEGFFRKNYSLSWDYIKKTKSFFLFSLIIFFLAIIIGVMYPSLFVEQVQKLIEELLKQTEGLGHIQLIGFIMGNNIKSAFFAMIFGLVFSIFPISMILVNGYVIGFVINKTALNLGLLELWKLFPHGILEIPAILISVGLGIKIGLFQFSAKNKTRAFLSFIVSLILLFIFLDVFLAIAAVFSGSKETLALQTYYSGLFDSSLFFIVFILVFLISFILSCFIGVKVFLKKDRKIVLNNLKNYVIESIRVFVFFVIPLLIVAAIIEGVLIWLTG